MKTINYRLAGTTVKTQFKTVGQGWEVCVHMGKKCIFVGNFIHRGDANKWWTIMNGEMKNFTRTYWIGNKTVPGWYSTFVANHLYKTYYKFLDRIFTKYNRTYARSVNQNVKKYNTLRRGWTHQHRYTLTKAA